MTYSEHERNIPAPSPHEFRTAPTFAHIIDKPGLFPYSIARSKITFETPILARGQDVQTRLPVQPVLGGSCHNGVVMRISPAASARRAAVATRRFGGQMWKGALIDEGENKLL